MQEIELKFQIPAPSLEAVRTELARLALAHTNDKVAFNAPLILQAAYFDTPDRKLARARSALRVRREGDDWVQTLKAAGSNTMVRVEDNRPTSAPQPGEPFAPRLSLHAGSPAEAALRLSLGWLPEEDTDGAQCGLVQLYATDMRRTRVQLVIGAGTPREGVVELALDEGAILAGSDAAQLSVPVRELEIELISGHPQAVIDAGREWVQTFGLWLDTQTKAHRGDRLAKQAIDGDANAARPKAFAMKKRPAKAAAAWQAGIEACLAHITAHMSELASLNETGDDALTTAAAPVIQQWLRGLRRLRALGKLCDRPNDQLRDAARAPGSGLAPSASAQEALQTACALATQLTRQLSDASGIHGPQALTPAIAAARGAMATEVCLLLLTALMA